MIRKGIDIYGCNTLGMDTEQQKRLPTNKELTDLQKKAGDIIRNGAYRYIGREGKEIYSQLVEIGKNINEITLPTVQERKNLLLGKLRTILKSLKPYNDSLLIEATDSKNIEWSAYKLAKDYLGLSDWYGTPQSDQWYLNVLKEYKRVRNLYKEVPMAVRDKDFDRIGEDVIRYFRNRYID